MRLNNPDWSTKVFDLTDELGHDKITGFTSEEKEFRKEIDLVRNDGVLYDQENILNQIASFTSILMQPSQRRTSRSLAPLTPVGSTGPASTTATRQGSAADVGHCRH